MSITRNGPSAGSSPRVAPSKDSAASSAPLDDLGVHAQHVRAPGRRNSSRLAASRVALVATIRTASTPSSRQVAA